MIKKIALGFLAALAALVAIVLIMATFQPDTMTVSRSATFAAKPEAVFAVVNDFSRWDEWSPWAKVDPEMKVTLEGPTSGVGAVYRWSGNSQAGEGSNTLTESVPGEKVAMKLEFVRPFPGTADVHFTFAPEGPGSKVTWNMTSPQVFLGKVMGVFMDCEKMCGDSFLEGFENLRKIVEVPAGT